MPSRPTRTRSLPRPTVLVAAAAAGLATLATLGACGGSTEPVASTATTVATESTYEIVPDAEVTAGLAKVRSLANEVRSHVPSDPAAAKASSTEMYEAWEEFEGTVKKNDRTLYLQIEDGMAAVRSGAEAADAALVDKGIGDIAGAATLYLKAHP